MLANRTSGLENSDWEAGLAYDGLDHRALARLTHVIRVDRFSLALTVATEGEAHRAFDALADGGEVQMPLGQTFWSPCYGMLKDRFGVHWMVMVPGSSP